MSMPAHGYWLPFMAIALGLAMAGFLGAPAAGQESSVVLVEVDVPITPVVADYVESSIEEAEEKGSQMVIITLDTPGGLDVSMRDIVQVLLNATIPAVVYVSPEGARAASAGTFITMAADVAAMAPATAMRAATPLDMQGGEITDKVINDAAAFAGSVAERRGRSAEFAEASVREGRS